MFRRAAAYHPYKKSAPPSAGFRLGDFILKRRCFNLFGRPADFATTRPPDPSPSSSPVKDALDPERDSDTPPTIPLSDFLAAADLSSPQRPSTPFPNRRRNPTQHAAGPSEESAPPPRRHKKHGPRHLSFENNASHRARGALPRRRSQFLQAKREALRKKLHDDQRRRMATARNALTHLCDEADALMSPEHMNDEDWIFMEQLEKLQLDQMYAHDLERWRQRMANAAEETEKRRKAHEARDAEAERLWNEQPVEEAREEQKKMVEEFVRRKDKSWESRVRQADEEAIRADERRQQAHQAAEREVREKQERLFREEQARKAEDELRRQLEHEQRRLREERERLEREEKERLRREQVRRLQEEVDRVRKERKERERQERRVREEAERQRQEALDRFLREEQERIREAQRERQERQEQERKLREEIERQRREANERFLREQQERLAREEQERQARMRAEEARRIVEEAQLRQYFALYERKWQELRTNDYLPPIDVREMPWPIIGVVSSADQITYEGVRTFLFHPLRPGVEGKTAREKVKSEVLRFHPDKFNTRIVPKIQVAQQAVAYEIAGAIARILTTIMTEAA